VIDFEPAAAGNFEAVGSEPNELERSGGTIQQVRAVVPLGSANRRFVRLRVTSSLYGTCHALNIINLKFI
jgi:hypothetical protein